MIRLRCFTDWRSDACASGTSACAKKPIVAIRMLRSRPWGFTQTALWAFILWIALNPAFATAPDHQTVLVNNAPAWNDLYGVVRIRDQGGFQGTGAVFHKRQVGNDFWLCVLTADHVVRGGFGIHIGFANEIPDVVPRGPEFNVDRRLVFLGGDERIQDRNDPTKFHSPDIAVLGVRVPANIFSVTPTYALAGREALFYNMFSIVGYGNTGIRHVDQNGNWLGYRRVPDSYGTKRFANNVADRFLNMDSNIYHFQAIEWDLDPPGNNPPPGEGVTFDGDSGAPYFASRVDMIDDIPVRTEFIVGVHHAGQSVGIGPHTIKPFGTMGWGVELIPEYRDWIYEKCDLIPEPASLLALSVGLVSLLRRRRRTA